MSETAASLLFLIVAGMVAIGLLVLLFRILTALPPQNRAIQKESLFS